MGGRVEQARQVEGQRRHSKISTIGSRADLLPLAQLGQQERWKLRALGRRGTVSGRVPKPANLSHTMGSVTSPEIWRSCRT